MSDCLKVFNVKEYLEFCREKEQKLDRLMFDCWRKGLKHRDILDMALEIDSTITSEQVKEAFKEMFTRELSDKAVYLEK